MQKIFYLIITGVFIVNAKANNFKCFSEFPKISKVQFKTTGLSDKIPEWDLSFLYKGIDDKNIIKDIESSVKESKEFKKKYQTKIQKEKLSASELLKAIIKYEEIQAENHKAQAYMYYTFYMDMGDQNVAAMLGRIDNLSSDLYKNLSFFENDLARTSTAYKDRVFKSKILSRYSNYLYNISITEKHLLTEEQEELLIDTMANGRSAWIKFRSIFESKYSFKFKAPGSKKEEDITLSGLLKYIKNENREVRQRAFKTILSKFKEDQYAYAFMYNSVIQDMMRIEKNRRGYKSIMKIRNLDNQLPDNIVKTMHDSVKDNYKLAQRYWKLKAKVLGIKDFDNTDVYAPYVIKGEKPKEYTFKESVEMINKVLNAFDPYYAGMFENLYRCNLVDALIRKGKRGGAFCASTTSGYPPIIAMNFNGQLNDVSTLSHELGHWFHFLLISENQPLSNSNVPTSTAETASIFSEMLLSSYILETKKDNPEELLSFLFEKIDGIIGSVFRQTAFSFFEQSVFNGSQKGPLPEDKFSEIFAKEYGELFGDAVKMTPEYPNEWARVPHFFRPFYVYAYSFGELATIVMYQNYLENKDGFPQKLTKFLTSGSSLEPVKQYKMVGVDLSKKATWQKGFDYISKLIDQAEKLSKEI